jgi:hypothetical protein
MSIPSSVPASIACTEDAIAVAEAVLGDEDELVAIVDGAAKLLVPISGEIPPDGIRNVHALLLEVAGDQPDCRLVLATRRHRGPSMVLESELALWRELLALHRGRELRLVDWLVFLDDGYVLSIAELAGPQPEWPCTY